MLWTPLDVFQPRDSLSSFVGAGSGLDGTSIFADQLGWFQGSM